MSSYLQDEGILREIVQLDYSHHDLAIRLVLQHRLQLCRDKGVDPLLVLGPSTMTCPWPPLFFLQDLL